MGARAATLFRREAIWRYVEIYEIEPALAIPQTCDELGCSPTQLLEWISLVEKFCEENPTASHHQILMALTPNPRFLFPHRDKTET